MTPRTFFNTTRFLILATVGFSLLALLSLATVSGLGVHHMSREEDQEVLVGLALLASAYKLQNTAEKEIILVRGFFLAPRLPGPAAERALFEAYDATLSQLRAVDHRPEDASLLSEIEALGDQYQVYSGRVFRLLREGRRDAALALYNAEGDRLKEAWIARLDELIVRQERFINAHHERLNRLESLVKSLLLVGAAFAIPIMLGLGILVIRRVLRPLKDLEDASQAIASGALAVRVPMRRQDEFGRVAGAFNVMAEQVERSVTTLRQANDELLRLDRHKDEFLSIASHELKTPLNALKGFASLMANGFSGELSAQQRAHVGHILAGAERMTLLVNELLDIATIRAGKLKLYPEPVTVTLLVEDVFEAMRPLAAEKGLALEAVCDPMLSVTADYTRVSQVLTNLVGNAIKFMEREGRIRVTVTREADSVRWEVTDTGPGIGADDARHLFQPFSQIDMGPTRKTGGTGLGLSISKALVEAHGGLIGLASTPGRGATFWFTLPLALSDDPA